MRLAITVLSLLLVAAGASAQGTTNLILDHADPFITPHPVAGNYLLLATSGNNLTVWSGPTVAQSAAHSKTVFTPTDGMREIWSPTLWHMQGHWWIYFTARMPGREHAIYALQSDTDDALGTYTFRGELNLQGRASIDPSLLTVSGTNYLMYVTVDSGANEIHIVRLAAPMQPVGREALLAKPEYPWERGAGTTRTYPVDEGPTALYHDGKTFVVFSASDTASPRYCLGLLTLKGGDPMLANNWAKSPEPVFSAAPGNAIWGPGRGTFAVGTDGTSWLLYAAKSTDAPTAQGRAIRAQRFSWRADGTPDFGVPMKDGAIPQP